MAGQRLNVRVSVVSMASLGVGVAVFLAYAASPFKIAWAHAQPMPDLGVSVVVAGA